MRTMKAVRPMAKDVAFAYRCLDCGNQSKLLGIFDDPTTTSGACPACGSRNWHIYAKDDQGRVRIVQ